MHLCRAIQVQSKVLCAGWEVGYGTTTGLTAECSAPDMSPQDMEVLEGVDHVWWHFMKQLLAEEQNLVMMTLLC